MTAKTAKAATTKKTATKTDLVAGRFRPESEMAKMYTYLAADGKLRSVEEIQAVTKSRKPSNIAAGKFAGLQRWGRQSKQYEMEKVDGKIRLVLKKAPAPAAKKGATK